MPDLIAFQSICVCLHVVANHDVIMAECPHGDIHHLFAALCVVIISE